MFGLINDSSALMQANVKFCILAAQIPYYQYSMEPIDGTVHVQLEETELEKDLGVHIDPELKFSKTRREASEQG